MADGGNKEVVTVVFETDTKQLDAAQAKMQKLEQASSGGATGKAAAAVSSKGDAVVKQMTAGLEAVNELNKSMEQAFAGLTSGASSSTNAIIDMEMAINASTGGATDLAAQMDAAFSAIAGGASMSIGAFDDMEASISAHEKAWSKTTKPIEKVKKGVGDANKETKKMSLTFSNTQSRVEKIQTHLNRLKHPIQAAKAEMSKLGQGWKDYWTKAKSSTPNLFGDMLKKIAPLAIGGALVGGIVSGIGNIINGVVSYAQEGISKYLDFSKSSSMYNTLARLDKSELQQRDKQVLELSSELGLDPNEIYSTMYNAVSAGTEEGQSLAYTAQAAKVSLAGGASLEDSGAWLSTAKNNFQSIDYSYEHISDVLFKTLEFGVTSVTAINQNVGRTLSSFAAAGLTYEDAMAAFGSATAIAGKGSDANVATAMKAFVDELNNNTGKTGKQFKKITGKTLADYTKAGHTLLDAYDVMADYAKKNGLATADVFQAQTSKQFANWLSAAGARELFGKNFESVVGDAAAGATAEAYSRATDNPAFKLQKAQQQFSNIQLMVGEKLMTAFVPVFDMLEQNMPSIELMMMALADAGADVIAQLVDELPKLVPAIQNLTKWITEAAPKIAAAVGQFVKWLGHLIEDPMGTIKGKYNNEMKYGGLTREQALEKQSELGSRKDAEYDEYLQTRKDKGMFAPETKAAADQFASTKKEYDSLTKYIEKGGEFTEQQVAALDANTSALAEQAAQYSNYNSNIVDFNNLNENQVKYMEKNARPQDLSQFVLENANKYATDKSGKLTKQGAEMQAADITKQKAALDEYDAKLASIKGNSITTTAAVTADVTTVTTEGANMETGMQTSATNVQQTTTAMVSDVKSTAGSLDLYNEGYNAGAGYANGIDAAAPLVKNAANNLVANAKTSTATAQDSHSPSRLFASLGAFVSQGYAKGIEDESYLAGDATRNMVGEAQNGVDGVDSGLPTPTAPNGAGGESVFAPVINIEINSDGTRTAADMAEELRLKVQEVVLQMLTNMNANNNPTLQRG